MNVEAIHVGAPMDPELRAVESVGAVAGKGLEGDRHFSESGAKPGQALTLVEREVVEDVGLAPGGTRRQLTVSGTGLNDLVGRRFRIGAVECYGVELCEPCAHLQSVTQPGVLAGLVHRGGLRADVLTDGEVAAGDAVVSAA
jgi:MOSC domain-containing protein YiiM